MLILIGGIPAHPMVVHGVVVLLPLAAVGAVAVAIRPRWRRRLGVPVLLIALVGVALIPVAEYTGRQLWRGIGGSNPLIAVHQQRAGLLLPFALSFLLLFATTVLLDWREDRVRVRLASGVRGGGSLSRLTATTAAFAALAGMLVTVLVMWIGHAGASATWQGVIER